VRHFFDWLLRATRTEVPAERSSFARVFEETLAKTDCLLLGVEALERAWRAESLES